jgi:hypothetical protein
MTLRTEKIVEAALVLLSKGVGEKEEVLGIRTQEIPLCTRAPLPQSFHIFLIFA